MSDYMKGVVSKVSNNPRGKNSLAAVKGTDRTRTILIQVGVAVVLLALIAAIGISIAVKHSKKTSDANARPTIAATAPTGPGGVAGSITSNGSIRIGKPDAKVTVRVVADLQCPVCQGFEAANGQTLEDEVNNGTAAVEYNLIAFLDESSMGARYSSRAANAAYCVATADPSKFQNWVASMYQQQPQEGTTGLPDGKIIQITTAAGYTDPSVAQCITSDKYDGFVQKTTQEVINSGIHATPTVFVNGKQVDSNDRATLFNPGGIKATIEAAAK
ncbi:protein-disulfide isomerase [Nocardia sp. GAS34]|uniref:DsbA family protein n=2 Tax=unclassified Nocardia TaxID=2637762 RepID=UPI003D244174